MDEGMSQQQSQRENDSVSCFTLAMCLLAFRFENGEECCFIKSEWCHPCFCFCFFFPLYFYESFLMKYKTENKKKVRNGFQNSHSTRGMESKIIPSIGSSSKEKKEIRVSMAQRNTDLFFSTSTIRPFSAAGHHLFHPSMVGSLPTRETSIPSNPIYPSVKLPSHQFVFFRLRRLTLSFFGVRGSGLMYRPRTSSPKRKKLQP